MKLTVGIIDGTVTAEGGTKEAFAPTASRFTIINKLALTAYHMRIATVQLFMLRRCNNPCSNRCSHSRQRLQTVALLPAGCHGLYVLPGHRQCSGGLGLLWEG